MQIVDALTVSVLVDNSSDMLSTRPPHIASELRVLISAGMQDLTGEGLCSAHHGLSLVVTTRLVEQRRRCSLLPFFAAVENVEYRPRLQQPQLPSTKSRSTITATLPSVPVPAFSDRSPALIASTVLSIVLPTCGTTSPCTAHSIARVMPRWRKAFASSSRVAGSEK